MQLECVKNCNIQERNKIKNQGIETNLKRIMESILTEVNIEKFKELYGDYFKQLNEAVRNNFLEYLTK